MCGRIEGMWMREGRIGAVWLVRCGLGLDGEGRKMCYVMWKVNIVLSVVYG